MTSTAPRRYFVVGALCAVLNVVLMHVLASVGLHWAAATALAFPFVLVVGYGLHIRWTFPAAPSWPSLGRYTLAMLSNYPLFSALLAVLCGLLDLPTGPAAAIATGGLFIWNYVATRWAILPARPPRRDTDYAADLKGTPR